MIVSVRLGAFGMLFVVMGVAPAASAMAAELTLKRVMLSSGGTGYFEYETEIDGDGQLTLDVPLEQVDDILKSLVIYDAAGRAGAVTLPGREPLTRSFADLPFPQQALDSPAGLLNALQGSEIKVQGPKPMAGRLLRVVEESAKGADGLAITRNRVAVMTDAGLQQFLLDEADSVAFADAELQRKVGTALSRLDAFRSDGRRRLTIESRGAGKRKVSVGYVVGAPLWKASYRLSLPADTQSEEARLQGWAVLENFSGQPWHDVQLTLLSGNPVSFRQALFESYYVERPQIPVEIVGRILPAPDQGSVPTSAAKAESAPGGSVREDRARLFRPSQQSAEPLGASTPAPIAAFEAPPPPPAPAPASIDAADAAEGTTQIAFTLPSPVSVEAGQSVVVPILDRNLPARQLDLYQPATDRRNPLATVELRNASGTGLPPGVLTLFQSTAQGAAYVGDARIGTFPTGEKRLLSYAVDPKLRIMVDQKDEQRIVKASIAQGVLRVTRLTRRSGTYHMTSQPGVARRLLIEVPRQPGYTLVSPDPAATEQTDAAYRIPVALSDTGDTIMTIASERPVEESIRIVNAGNDSLGIFASSDQLSPAIRKALTDVAARRQEAQRLRLEADRLQKQRKQIEDDEGRIRANLSSVTSDSALRKRLLDRLSESETALDQLSSAIAKAQADADRSEADLQAFVAGLRIS